MVKISATPIPRRPLVFLPMLLVGIFLLGGCVYVPSAEHPINPQQKDFRSLVDSTKKDAPVHAGVGRPRIVTLLGTTEMQSPNHRAAVYFLDLEAGRWVGLGVPNSRKVIGLILLFDDHENLADWRLVERAVTLNEGGIDEFPKLHMDLVQSDVPEIPTTSSIQPTIVQPGLGQLK